MLTNAADFPRWNSTVISIDGEIKQGGKIQLKSTFRPEAGFKFAIKEFEPDHRLAWGDAMGKRVYTLKTIGQNLTQFTMTEKIGGPIFPLFAKMIPFLIRPLNNMQKDLKREAESISKN